MYLSEFFARSHWDLVDWRVHLTMAVSSDLHTVRYCLKSRGLDCSGTDSVFHLVILVSLQGKCSAPAHTSEAICSVSIASFGGCISYIVEKNWIIFSVIYFRYIYKHYWNVLIFCSVISIFLYETFCTWYVYTVLTFPHTDGCPSSVVTELWSTSLILFYIGCGHKFVSWIQKLSFVIIES